MYEYGGSGGVAVVGIIAAIAVFSALAGAVGIIARDYHGKSGLKWFILSVILSPVLALLFLLAVADRPAQAAGPAPTAQAAMKQCTRCGKDMQGRPPRVARTAATTAVGVDTTMPPSARWVPW